MYIYFETAEIKQSHAKLVMQWRNDPTTLRMFYQSLPKTWPKFWHEYKNDYFKNPTHPPYFAYIHNTPIAFLRSSPYKNLQSKKNIVDIDINIAPKHRKKGYGSQILTEFSNMLLKAGADTIIAEIKQQNKASIHAFEKAGFRFFDTSVKHIENTSCKIFRFRKTIKQITPATREQKPKTFIIAEAGSNWRMGKFDRDITMGKTLIDIAVDAGADAVKFQTYRAKTVYVPNAGQADYLKKSGQSQDISAIFDDLSMPYSMIPTLASYAQDLGIEFMSTPFSIADLKALNPYVRRHKLASYELSHVRLLDALAKTGKPLIMSTGAANLEEVQYSVNRFYQQGGQDLSILQCTASYPAPLQSLNLNVIRTLQQRFLCKVGLSDHSRDPFIAPVTAVALGASVIEKHFTIDNRLPGPDHAFAITPKKKKKMVEAIRHTEKALGTAEKKPNKTEYELRSFAIRRIQAITPIKKGEKFQEGKNFSVLRPGKQPAGMHPRFIDHLKGSIAKRDIKLGHGILQDDF